MVKITPSNYDLFPLAVRRTKEPECRGRGRPSMKNHQHSGQVKGFKELPSLYILQPSLV